ncbi:MAG: glycosyltransferase family 4 protein [Sphingomonadales bacterium]
MFLISSWSSGGAPLAAMRIAEGLCGRGHIAEVWYLYRRTDLPLVQGHAHILVDRDVRGSLGMAMVPWRLLKRLDEFKPDAVITFTPLAHVLGQAVAWLKGIRIRVAAHRIVCWQYSPVLRTLDMMLGSLGGYSRVATVSEAVRQSLASYPARYRRRVEVVHNGVERSPSKIGRREARAAFGLPEEGAVVLAVGRLADQKNYPLLIAAVSQLEDVHLVVAGTGEKQGELERQAAGLGMSERLHLLGQLSPAALSDLFRACDIFALASLFEGQSNALLEAMAEGMPIVASDIPEQVETLRDDEGRDAAILLPVNDPGLWANAIAKLLSDPALCASLSKSALERAKYFSPGRMLDSFEAMVREE